MMTLLLAASLSAWATDKATVSHYTAGEARKTASGAAQVWRIAGAQEGAKNAFFAVLELQPGAKVPVHRDDTEEYIYILSGTGQMTIDGVTTPVGPGTGVFMPAKAEVSFVADAEEPVRAVQFFAAQGPEAKYEGWLPVSGETP
jgi:quercetin dioxygenase-like cupin family protein